MLNRLIVIACVLVSSVSVHADDVAGDNLVSDDSTPLMGGYGKADTLDHGVQQAAEFAADQINKGDLVSILSVESQVVAGTNYKLKLVISMANGTQHVFAATVFYPLPNSGDAMQLVDYEDQGVYATRN